MLSKGGSGGSSGGSGGDDGGGGGDGGDGDEKGRTPRAFFLYIALHLQRKGTHMRYYMASKVIAS